MSLYEDLKFAAQQKLVVEVTPDFAVELGDVDTYLETGMRGYITDVQKKPDGILEVFMDVDSFLEHNKQFETQNWVVTDTLKKDVPPAFSNAREAGWYEPELSFYCNASYFNFFGDCLRPLNPAAAKLMTEYAESILRSRYTYVGWLEQKVIENAYEDELEKAHSDTMSP